MIDQSEVDVTDIVFMDVEADRTGRVLAVGAVRGDEAVRIEVRRGVERAAASKLTLFVRDSAIGGHNFIGFDKGLLAQPPLGWFAQERPILDTLTLSMLADPMRMSHALGKQEQAPGSTPDPVADARESRERAEQCWEILRALDPEISALYASLLAEAGHRVAAHGLSSAFSKALENPAAAARQLPESLLSRMCRVQLPRLLETVHGGPAEILAFALAVRFIEVSQRAGQVPAPPSPALASLPRFTELLTRLLGPLCPDHRCVHRASCDVHRPFAEEILERNFELPGFRPHQSEIVHAVLGAELPLVVLPTGGGKSLCYQLPAVHGAERLHGLTVVISPLQALMADQVSALSVRYPAVCFINAQLTMAERQQVLLGLRTGKYNIVYLGPEQLRNPSISRLLRNRPPFLWVIDEAHCISQWGHSFRTDYTYLPRAIAEIHRLPEDAPKMPPLLALFTATATPEVRRDIAAQVERGLGVSIAVKDYGSRRDNLAYEVLAAQNETQKDSELCNLLAAQNEGARLVYCATVRTARQVAEVLRERGIACSLYHGRLPPREKAEQLERFLDGHARTVVATSAFGMGIDKADIRLVVHYELPGSLEDYFQQTGRAGRDGLPARCVLLYCENDLETQFYLKTSSRVTARDVRFVFKALRARARRLKSAEDGRVELWVVPEDLFAEERLDVELDWDRDHFSSKLKLVLYHLEVDGVLARRENRTRAFGIFPLLASIELAEQALPENTSPATLRVLRYLYHPQRPRRISILDLADETGLLPSEAFREMQSLARLELIGHDLAFEVTLSRGVSASARDIAAGHFQALEELFKLGEDLDDAPVLHLRSAAVEVGRAIGRSLPPHQLFHALRALRRQGLIRLDKVGTGRYRVRFEPNFRQGLEQLRAQRSTAEVLLEYADTVLGGQRGKDLRFELDINAFLRQSTDLFRRRSADDVVSACLLLHHLEAWHLDDPPVVLETAIRVSIDPTKPVSALDLTRPKRNLEHDIGLVHQLREYALLPAERREAYARDYFELAREDFLDKYFKSRRRGLIRPVSPATEERLLEGLTEAQQSAVTAQDGALLVVAGPGSGKTHTVVRRIAHMVRARQIRPEEILVLAFNRSAAAELRERVEGELGARAAGVDIRTFHSFALRLTGADLRDDADDADRVLDEALVRAAELLGAPALSQGSADHRGGQELEETNSEELRLRVLGPVRHVIVDEYQDLDADQYRLLTTLVGLERSARATERTERTVYVVGDDDQAVYGFRAASVEFLRRFEQEFGARRICLAENFRSNAPIVEAAARFATTLPDRIKTLPDEQVRPAPSAAPGGTNSVRRFRYRNHQELSAHAAFMARKSLEAQVGSIAILARHWAALDAVRYLLETQGVNIVIHHRAFHRPVHRRHPAFRMIRHLWDHETPIEGSAVDFARELFERWGRTTSERPVLELLTFAEEVDRSRSSPGGRLAPIGSKELADELLLASRDAALRDRAHAAPNLVHLCTFHGSKGLEFDKVIVFPSCPKPTASHDELGEERRAYYVAMTRAKRELVLATLVESSDLSLEVESPEQDLR
ncbi:MAG TPA: RecQ family ATP-dependent DNA helicase, partial [Polyangiaceae bacterium]